MDKIKTFIIREFEGWKAFELCFLVIVYILALYNWFFLHDNIFAVMAAICGATATAAAGKGKISTYFFGIIGCISYSYIAFKSKIYGNFLINFFYYLPMQFVGINEWRKHMKVDKQEIVKTKLTKKELIVILGVLILSLGVFSQILIYFKDAHPYLDAITTVGSIFGFFLSVKRCFEQWFVWFIVNGLTLYIWITMVLNGEKAYSAVIQWGAYYIIGIYFMYVWYKELKN